MKKLACIYLFLILAQPVWAQQQKEINLPSFASIKVFGPFRVILHPGESEKAIILADEDLLDNIMVEVKNGRLKIKFIDDIWRKENPRIEVHYKVISEIVAEADSRVMSAEAIRTESLRLALASGAQADLEIQVNQVDITVTTGAKLLLSGRASVEEAQVNTGGEIDALDLDSPEVYVKAGTGGMAQVRALKFIDARSSTGGHITYSGNPEMVDRNTTFGGTINKIR